MKTFSSFLYNNVRKLSIVSSKNRKMCGFALVYIVVSLRQFHRPVMNSLRATVKNAVFQGGQDTFWKHCVYTVCRVTNYA